MSRFTTTTNFNPPKGTTNMSYTLDPNAAKAADAINARIEKTGKYLGTFTRAEPVTSKKGTKGVDFSFKADTGESADYLTLWTHNGEGKQLQGFNVLMAIMTCLQVRNIAEEVGTVEKYDQEQKKRIQVDVPLFKELMGKPIGLLLQMEEYAKTAGGTAWKPSFFGVFNKDEFTASEILNKSKAPETLAKMVLALRDRPLKGSIPVAAAPSATPHDAGSFNDFEDDLPF